MKLRNELIFVFLLLALIAAVVYDTGYVIWSTNLRDLVAAVAPVGHRLQLDQMALPQVVQVDKDQVAQVLELVVVMLMVDQDQTVVVAAAVIMRELVVLAALELI